MSDRQCLLVPGEVRNLQSALHKVEDLEDRSSIPEAADADEFLRACRPRVQSQREDQLSERLSAVAVVDAEDTVLAPGEEALVPAVWDRAVPQDDFVCETCVGTEYDIGVDAAPGICPGGTAKLMVSVQNALAEEVELTRGMPVARAVETVAELSGMSLETLKEGEALARKAVKRGDFTLDSVLNVLRLTPIPLSDTRSNVAPVGQTSIRSMLLGLYIHGNGAQYGVTGVARDLWWTVRLLSGTFRRQFPQFPFTSIQINKGFACRPHVDKRNSGPSALISLGEHTGGDLWVHEEDGGVLLSIRPDEGHASGRYRIGVPYPGQVFRPSEGWVVFDGRQLHCTLPFEGERYSLVFFCGPHLDKVPFSVKHEMFESGFDFDWDEGSVRLAAGACEKASGVRVPSCEGAEAVVKRYGDGGCTGFPTPPESVRE